MDRLLSNKRRRIRIWDVPALCMGEKSKTHLTYTCFLLNQIKGAPAFISKRRCAFLKARLPFYV
jgi:hypothetical protein